MKNRLRLLWLCFLMIIFVFVVPAQVNSRHVHVNGYYKKNGTYVQPYHRTAPNSTKRDNFSTKGNTNPYTGKPGWIPSDGNNTYYSNPNNNTSNLTDSELENIINIPNKSNISIKCQHSACIEDSRIDTFGYQSVRTIYCSKHTPKCANPYCSNFAKADFLNIYDKYCEAHQNTCIVVGCYNKARLDNYGYQSVQTHYCSIHTPKCANPYCNNFARIDLLNNYDKYCETHENTCIVNGCYDKARVDNSGYQTTQTRYCEKHSPKCQYPNCSNFASYNYLRSISKYCSLHKD